LENKIEGIDYIKCELCNYHGKSLKTHLTKVHKSVESLEYEKQYGKLICEVSSRAYADGVRSHESWVAVARREGKDLSEYWNDISRGVINAIRNNPEEIQRRSKHMTELNDKQQSDPKFQKIVSDTARKTSVRPEILEARSKKLAQWRKDNPDDFYEKCIKKMIATFQSKPEKKLFEFVNSIDGFSFKRNQFIHSEIISTKSKKKQIDMGDKKNRFYIEFDGILHFEPKRGYDLLKIIQKKDGEIEQHISNHNWTLIRVSYDQYIDKNKIEKSYFKQECLDRIIEILNNKTPGIYKIGEAYGKH